MSGRTTVVAVILSVVVVGLLVAVYAGVPGQLAMVRSLTSVNRQRLPAQVLPGPGAMSVTSMTMDRNVSKQFSQAEEHHCDNVIERMVRGRWQPRNASSQEIFDVETFHRKFREGVKMPRGLQREDKQCRTVTFPGATSWWRALCDKDGDTPCCYNNVCVNRSKENCTCSNCLDLRQVIHAELSTWVPVEAACRMRSLAVEEICRTLDTATIYFIGDSLARHTYTAFLLAVRGNELTGAMLNSTPPAQRSECSGLYMFTEKVCRKWLDRNVTICNGRVEIQFLEHYKLQLSTNIHQAVQTLRQNAATRRSIVFLSLGLHDGLDSTAVQQKVLLPLLRNRTQEELSRPRLVWMSVPCPGLLKNGNQRQGRENVLRFNREMDRFLRTWHVPVLERFNMTDGVMSFDGTHFGLGLNRAAAQVILYYLRELRLKRLW